LTPDLEKKSSEQNMTSSNNNLSQTKKEEANSDEEISKAQAVNQPNAYMGYYPPPGIPQGQFPNMPVGGQTHHPNLQYPPGYPHPYYAHQYPPAYYYPPPGYPHQMYPYPPPPGYPNGNLQMDPNYNQQYKDYFMKMNNQKKDLGQEISE